MARTGGLKMKSIATLALSLALTAAVAAPAFAGEHAKEVFPMAGDVFQQKVEARLERGKAHVEKRIVDAKVDATKAQEMRSRFEERAAKVRAATAQAVQDGVVTEDEAKAVRAAGGGGHHKHPKAETK